MQVRKNLWKYTYLLFIGLVSSIILLFVSTTKISAEPSELELKQQNLEKEVALFEKELYSCMYTSWSSNGLTYGLGNIAAKIDFTISPSKGILTDSFQITSFSSPMAVEKTTNAFKRVAKQCKFTFPPSLKEDYKANFSLVSALNKVDLNNYQSCGSFSECLPNNPSEDQQIKDSPNVVKEEETNSSPNAPKINYKPFMERIEQCIQNQWLAQKHEKGHVRFSWIIDPQGKILQETLKREGHKEGNISEDKALLAILKAEKCFGKAPKGAPKKMKIDFTFRVFNGPNKITNSSSPRMEFNKGSFDIHRISYPHH
ncbi:MAG: hypothetical protein SFU25_00300 [Candidatus Caenarcaniphilales bacterium]|nr:hypothetical protein [Candidatus Caenarcaniphilales bacterium]